MKREDLATLISERLSNGVERFEEGNFKYWVIDNLLPNDLATDIAQAFPSEGVLRAKDSLREYKRIGIDFDSYDKLMEEITYAFHDVRVVKKIEQITRFKGLEADSLLYAGGLSSMSKNSFLNPHLDNSHNNDGTKYRALNLLYYISEGWEITNGGNLILYPNGLNGKGEVIPSRFNSLVLMETNEFSYHGVSKVSIDRPRRCISNYYFSQNSTSGSKYRYKTSFFAFPEQSLLKKTLFSLDRYLRNKFSNSFKVITNYQSWHIRKDG